MMQHTELLENDFSINYLDPKDARVERDPVNEMPRVHLPDRCILRASFSRAFPFSKPHEFIGLMDGEGKEVGVFKSLHGMDNLSLDIIDQEMTRRYFTPKVNVVYDMTKEVDMWKLEVGTDRGDRTYFVRHWRDNAHEIGAGRWLVNTVDGTRFEIPDVNKLDKRSVSFLDQLS